MKDVSMTLFQSDAMRRGKDEFRDFVDDKIRTLDGTVPAPAGPASLTFPEADVHPLESFPGVPHVPEKPQAVKAIKVGLWDVNSLAGDLGLAISTLNGAQDRFRFFEICGAAPACLISDKERVIAWLRRVKGRVAAADKKEIEENTIAEDFYPYARHLREQLTLDYIVGLTFSMIAFEDGDSVQYNYFAASEEKRLRELLVSTYGLREYAERAKRPLEAAIGGVVISILLVAANPKLEYHENTGCLFDFNEDRDSIVGSIRDAKIDPECVKKMRPKDREASLAMVQALRSLPLQAGKKRIKS